MSLETSKYSMVTQSEILIELRKHPDGILLADLQRNLVDSGVIYPAVRRMLRSGIIRRERAPRPSNGFRVYIVDDKHMCTIPLTISPKQPSTCTRYRTNPL